MRATTYYRLPLFVRGLLPARLTPNVALTLSAFTAAVDDLRAIEASSRQLAGDIEANIATLRNHANEVWQECVRAKHAAANIEHNVLGVPKPRPPVDAYGRIVPTAEDIEQFENNIASLGDPEVD